MRARSDATTIDEIAVLEKLLAEKRAANQNAGRLSENERGGADGGTAGKESDMCRIDGPFKRRDRLIKRREQLVEGGAEFFLQDRPARFLQQHELLLLPGVRRVLGMLTHVVERPVLLRGRDPVHFPPEVLSLGSELLRGLRHAEPGVVHDRRKSLESRDEIRGVAEQRDDQLLADRRRFHARSRLVL